MQTRATRIYLQLRFRFRFRFQIFQLLCHSVLQFLVASVLVVACSDGAQAQGDVGSDFSMFLGYMLPNQIDGVTEILPIFGGRYAFGLPAGAVEISGENSHAQGIDWTSFGLSLRGEIPVATGVTGLIYAGPSLHYYAPVNDTARRSDYGFHFGIGGLMLVTDSLWLRSDLKFMGNPGTSLYLMFGLMFRPSSR